MYSHDHRKPSGQISTKTPGEDGELVSRRCCLCLSPSLLLTLDLSVWSSCQRFCCVHVKCLLPYIHAGNNLHNLIIYAVKGCLLFILSTCGVGLAQYPGSTRQGLPFPLTLGLPRLDGNHWLGVIGARGWHIKGPQPGGALASLVSVGPLGPRSRGCAHAL